jgi:hypothetical protein
MDRQQSMMLYVFGGPMDGLIVRAVVEDGKPKVNTAGTVRSREYSVREIFSDNGPSVRAFVHQSVSDSEAAKRYRAVSRRSQA